ncbi:MAG TPA: SOS response-associated peptidase family protein [Candidatus Saccharimonadales bacterium]|nr:SOS response-associated peptidase family protein [Candidatus Saccharimonadales bacterium]
MCGRYSMFAEETELVGRFHVRLADVSIRPTYNAAPGQELTTILDTDPRLLTLSTWGFVPPWAAGRAGVRPVINARAETVATKPFFKHAFKWCSRYTPTMQGVILCHLHLCYP